MDKGAKVVDYCGVLSDGDIYAKLSGVKFDVNSKTQGKKRVSDNKMNNM